MAERRLGLILNVATGRMGTMQHLPGLMNRSSRDDIL